MEEELHTRVRMPKALHDKIESARDPLQGGSGRSFTAEVVARLERTFIEDSVTDKDVEGLRASIRGLEARMGALEAVLSPEQRSKLAAKKLVDL